ncbi:hypothetical protein OOT46_11895 [Aquabacterium sp. A7-Y]|uniref:hypothetical protein n=1 Tax=Aquabacterium sp. A7-Y TaxID=1349605 RepID=UPI00223D1B42|nr:hypothetical protein [Aquabacterium sp. A7-Y]MCW7538544.1 hypothetical protein [Aquabacterium sp. A7-Y]
MRFLHWLVRRDPAPPAPQDRHIDEMLERVLDVIPRLRIPASCKERLAPVLGMSLKYLEGLVAVLPGPLEIGWSSWELDPRIRSFFASPAEISLALGRSSDLRALFEEAPDADEAYAVLSMRIDERRRFGVMKEGDAARVDVAQTVVSFSDHQVRICARTLAGLRQEIVKRLVDQLALEALARMAAEDDRREELVLQRALLATRLRLLQRRGTGMQSLLGSAGEAGGGKPARLREQIQANERDLDALGPLSGALDRQVERVVEVFRNPRPLVHIGSRSLRLSRMNVVLPLGSTDMGEVVEFQLAHVPGDPPQERAFALVRIARADLPKPTSLLEEAARWIG